MSFSERRGRRDARALALLAAASLILVASRASASPIDDPFVTGMSFSGPTSGDLGAIYWNPAALGLMRGFQLMVAGTARWSSVGVSSTPPGQPAGIGDRHRLPAAVSVAARPGRLRGARVRQRSVHARLRHVHALPRTDPFSGLADGQRADPLPGAEHGSAQPGAGAGAGDPVRQRLPDRPVVGVPVLDRQPQLRRGPGHGAQNCRPTTPATTSTRARGSATRSSRSRWAAGSTGATRTWSSASPTRASRWAARWRASRSPATRPR